MGDLMEFDEDDAWNADDQFDDDDDDSEMSSVAAFNVFTPEHRNMKERGTIIQLVPPEQTREDKRDPLHKRNTYSGIGGESPTSTSRMNMSTTSLGVPDLPGPTLLARSQSQMRDNELDHILLKGEMLVPDEMDTAPGDKFIESLLYLMHRRKKLEKETRECLLEHITGLNKQQFSADMVYKMMHSKHFDGEEREEISKAIQCKFNFWRVVRGEDGGQLSIHSSTRGKFKHHYDFLVYNPGGELTSAPSRKDIFKPLMQENEDSANDLGWGLGVTRKASHTGAKKRRKRKNKKGHVVGDDQQAAESLNYLMKGLNGLKTLNKKLLRKLKKDDMESYYLMQSDFYSAISFLDENKRLFDSNMRDIDRRERLAERQQDCLDRLLVAGDKMVIEDFLMEEQREIFQNEYEEFERLTLEIAQCDYRQQQSKNCEEQVRQIFFPDENVNTLTLDQLMFRWKKIFGVEFQRNKFESFLNNDQMKDRGLDKDSIGLSTILTFLYFEQRMDTHSVLTYIHDKKRMQAYFEMQTKRCFSFLFFCSLWLFLLAFLVETNGWGPDRYFASYGAKQQLIETVWDDIRFGDINGVDIMWRYIHKIVLPFAYGQKETEIEFHTDPYEEYNRLRGINPSLLGGIRFRNFKFVNESGNCPKPAEDWICPSNTKEMTDSPVDWRNVSYIEDWIYWRDREWLEEQEYMYADTKWTLGPSGYIWDLPPPTLGPKKTCDPSKPSEHMEEGHGYTQCDECDPFFRYNDVDPLCDYLDDPNCYTRRQMDYQLCLAQNQVMSLKDNQFVTFETRFMVVDFTMYYPTPPLHTMCRLVFEFKDGTIWPSFDIQTINFQMYNSDTAVALQMCFTLFVFGFVVFHLLQIRNHIVVLGPPGWWPKKWCCSWMTNMCKCRRMGHLPTALALNELMSHANDNLLQRSLVHCPQCSRRCWKGCMNLCGTRHAKELEPDFEVELETLEMHKLRFMEIFKFQDTKLKMSIPFLNITGEAILQKQQDIKEIVKSTLEIFFDPDNNDEDKIVVENIHLQQTDFGGVYVTLVFDNFEYDLPSDSRYDQIMEMVHHTAERGDAVPMSFRLAERSMTMTSQLDSEIHIDKARSATNAKRGSILERRKSQTAALMKNIEHMDEEESSSTSEYSQELTTAGQGGSDVDRDELQHQNSKTKVSFANLIMPDTLAEVQETESAEKSTDGGRPSRSSLLTDDDLQDIIATTTKIPRVSQHLDFEKTYDTDMIENDHGMRQLIDFVAEEIENSLDTDPLLRHATVLRYKPLRCRCVKGFCEYLVGPGVHTMYNNIFTAIDGILVFCFCTYLVYHLTYWTKKSVDEVDTQHFRSFRSMIQHHERERMVLFVLAFLSCLRLLQGLIGMNRQVGMFWDTMKAAGWNLFGFMMLLIVILFTFGLCGWLLFSSEVYHFRDPGRSIINLIRALLTDLPLDDLENVSGSGLLYYTLWWALVPFVLLNFFIALLLTAWDSTMKTEQASKSPDKFRNIQNVITYTFPWLSHMFHQEFTDLAQADQTVQDPKSWAGVYPAGCPRRKLEGYLVNNWEIPDQDVKDIVKFVDKDGGGTVDWNEITDCLQGMVPSLEGRHFQMNRAQMEMLQVLNKHQTDHRRDLDEMKGNMVHLDSQTSIRLADLEGKLDQVLGLLLNERKFSE